MLSTDGSESNAYAQRSIVWSPDSKRVAAYRVRPGYQRVVHFVESSPEDQLQPKHSERLYNKPGDVLDQAQPVLFDVATKRQTTVDNALFPNAYDVSGLAWRHDGSAFPTTAPSAKRAGPAHAFLRGRRAHLFTAFQPKAGRRRIEGLIASS